jgi:hypothetical protein
MAVREEGCSPCPAHVGHDGHAVGAFHPGLICPKYRRELPERRFEMTRILRVVALVLAAVSAIAVAAYGRSAVSGPSAEAAKSKPLRFEQHELYIEYNATDGDAGLQLAADAEDWKRFTLLDTKGKVLIDVRAKGRLRRPFGLSELFLEASEPPFAKVPFRTFKRRFPKGTYKFRGVASDGRRLAGSDRLSFVVPAAPRVTFPTKGAQVDPDGFKVTWEPVTRPSGVKIVTYQVIVNQGSRELSMYLPPDATSATIHGEFLEPDTETGGELLARERSGNQTITAFPSFRTK